MKNTHLIVAILSIGAVGSVAPAMAQQKAPSMEQRFARLDTNKDRSVSWEEAEAVRTRDFRAMDANKNGSVDRKEFTSGGRPFGAFDSNRDDKITKSEFLNAHRTMFRKFDKDKNGTLSMAEFRDAQLAAASQSFGESSRK